MCEASHAIHLPESVEKEALRLAEKAGISLDRWVSVAVIQKIAATESTSGFFKRRARGAESVDIRAILAKAGHEDPVPGDELPEELQNKFPHQR